MAADETEAANHYAAAARRGYARAQNNLAVCYADGRGRAPDSRLAVQWWKTAAASVSIPNARRSLLGAQTSSRVLAGRRDGADLAGRCVLDGLGRRAH